MTHDFIYVMKTKDGFDYYQDFVIIAKTDCKEIIENAVEEWQEDFEETNCANVNPIEREFIIEKLSEHDIDFDTIWLDECEFIEW